MRHVAARRLAPLALGLALAPLALERAFAHGDESGAPPGLVAWRAAHGDGWRARVERGTGRARFLSGGALAAEELPRDDAAWFALAERRVTEVEPLFGVALGDLQRVEVKHLDLVRVGTTDKTVVRFRQAPGGVPVERGTLAVLFGMDGELLAVDSSCLPDLHAFETAPFVPAAEALELARARFLADEGVAAEAPLAVDLVVARQREDEALRARLAWAVELAALPEGGEPRRRRVLVAADAGGARVLSSRSGVHRCAPHEDATPARAVHGTVAAFATPGIAADWAGNPPELAPLAYAFVAGPDGETAVSDGDGRFALANEGGGRARLRVGFEGPWARVQSAAGAETTLDVLAPPGPSGRYVLDATPDELATAEANAFRHVNRLREYVKRLDPADAAMDFQALATVNAAPGCGAAWFGDHIELSRAGSGCNNAAFSTIVAHEMGHWANERYGSGNGPDGFGEGLADAWSMYVNDTPSTGLRFQVGARSLRSGLNTVQYCGYQNQGCNGGIHANGQVLMGALWKVRRNLGESLGDALGDLTADVLFLSWMQAFDDAEIDPIVRDHWLALDDDDGDPSNGTPHFEAIHGGFAEHGLVGPPPGPGAAPVELVELRGADTASEGRFGHSVAVDEGLLVVGSRDDGAAAAAAGSANVYERVGGAWVHRQKLVAGDAAAGDHFGWSAAIEGRRVVVGAPHAGGAGAAYLFELAGGVWVERAKLVASDGAADDLFGYAVDVDRTTVLVGACKRDEGLTLSDTGAAYVFEREGGAWAERARLSAADRRQGDNFGISVAVEGDRAVIGAHHHNDYWGLSNTGAAYVFEREGGLWTERAELRPSNAVTGIEFGIDVDLSGPVVAVGAFTRGRAYLFRGGGSDWRQEAAFQSVQDGFLGRSVALDADLLAVGADGEGAEGLLYTSRRVEGRWTALVPTAPGAGAHERFGFCVAASNGTVVVGAPSTLPATGGGAAVVYELP